MCKCSDICKYHSKIEERKALKALNENNKFVLKEAISNPERKAYVLIQTELAKRHIDFWELRRQAADILLMLKRLNYCCKSLGRELNHFWMYYWATRYQKYLQERYWETADYQPLLQLTPLADKAKMLSARGIKSLADLRVHLSTVTKWFPQINSVNLLKEELEAYEHQATISFMEEKPNSSVWTMKLSYGGKFIGKLKGISICVGDSKDQLYYKRYISESSRELLIDFPKGHKNEYKVGLIKDGIIGFDEFYLMIGKEIEPFNLEQIGLKPPPKARKSAEPRKNEREQSLSNQRSSSVQISNNSKIKKQAVSPSSPPTIGLASTAPPKLRRASISCGIR